MRAISTAPVGAEASAPEERSPAADAPAASARSARSSNATTGRIFVLRWGFEAREKGKRDTRGKNEESDGQLNFFFQAPVFFSFSFSLSFFASFSVSLSLLPLCTARHQSSL